MLAGKSHLRRGITVRFSRCEAAAELAVMIVLRRMVRYTDLPFDSDSLSGLVANACVLYTFKLRNSEISLKTCLQAGF